MYGWKRNIHQEYNEGRHEGDHTCRRGVRKRGPSAASVVTYNRVHQHTHNEWWCESLDANPYFWYIHDRAEQETGDWKVRREPLPAEQRWGCKRPSYLQTYSHAIVCGNTKQTNPAYVKTKTKLIVFFFLQNGIGIVNFIINIMALRALLLFACCLYASSVQVSHTQLFFRLITWIQITVGVEDPADQFDLHYDQAVVQITGVILGCVQTETCVYILMTLTRTQRISPFLPTWLSSGRAVTVTSVCCVCWAMCPMTTPFNTLR